MSSQQAKAPYYFVPGPSRWPVLAGLSLLATMVGASAWVNSAVWGPELTIVGILALLVVGLEPLSSTPLNGNAAP